MQVVAYCPQHLCSTGLGAEFVKVWKRGASLGGRHLQVFTVSFLLLLQLLLSLQFLNLLLHAFVLQTFLDLLMNLLLPSGTKRTHEQQFHFQP